MTTAALFNPLQPVSDIFLGFPLAA